MIKTQEKIYYSSPKMVIVECNCANVICGSNTEENFTLLINSVDEEQWD